MNEKSVVIIDKERQKLNYKPQRKGDLRYPICHCKDHWIILENGKLLDKKGKKFNKNNNFGNNNNNNKL